MEYVLNYSLFISVVALIDEISFKKRLMGKKVRFTKAAAKYLSHRVGLLEMPIFFAFFWLVYIPAGYFKYWVVNNLKRVYRRQIKRRFFARKTTITVRVEKHRLAIAKRGPQVPIF